MGFNLKNISTINDIATSHGAGIKKVLCLNDEAFSNITQIAVSHLKAGETAGNAFTLNDSIAFHH